MIQRLLDRLERPVTFVVGKGGVGKTTTAGGLALAHAHAGTPTHLLSTDPAHSLSDLFDTRGFPCSQRLTIEESDGGDIARRHMERVEPVLRELLDRGTYLTAEEAETLSAGAFPGLDELGAALRLSELADSTDRLVVDTAPTGHTLRLLDIPATVSTWLRVFGALSEKADAVAAALVGQSVPVTGVEVLEELGARMQRFCTLIGEADFVVVTRAGAVVTAETRRLRRALLDRGLRVAAEVAVARPGAPAAEGVDLLLPWRADLRGCEALREWIDAGVGTGEPPDAEAPSDVRSSGAPPTVDASGGRRPAAGEPGVATLLDRRLLVFAGKGGVGKSTAAAAAALRLADDGPVTLLGADPADSLRDVLPDPPPGVDLRELDTGSELDRFRREYRAEVARAFESMGLGGARMDQAVIESLWDLSPPGLDELVSVARVAPDDEGDGGRVVLDPAPTGHFLSLLETPGPIRDWVLRLTRILLRYQAVAGLDDPAESLLRFARRLRALQERLSDASRTGIILVSLDEPLVRAETSRLAARLRERRVPVTAVLVNRQDPDTRREDRQGSTADREWDVPVIIVPEVTEPVGADRLRDHFGAWRLAS